MREFTKLEKAILQAAADYPSISPMESEAINTCDAMVREGLLKSVGHRRYENTEKGERAFHYSIGNGAAYDRVAAQ